MTGHHAAAGDPGVALDIDRARRRASRGDEALALNGRAFDLLAALAERPGEYIPPETLLQAVWPGRVVEPHNLRMQVNRLRQLLGPDAVTTQPGRGYRLELPVRRAATPNSPRLIGRDSELQELADQAREHRLLTVAGAGGIGKTSLVRHWFDGLAFGIVLGGAWVDLTGADKSQVPALTAAAFGLRETNRTWTTKSLVAALPARDWVLVLDNAEHLAAAVAAVVQDLLQALPGLRLVVTSQVPLRLPSEKVLRLGPLEVPEPQDSLEQALRQASMQLLLDRVRALDAGYQIDAVQLPDAIALCRQLDGVPLAIELAAARVPVLGLGTLVRSLDERLALLHSPEHSRPQRQQTLRAALEWTYALLSPTARVVYARLGVFTGAFAFDAAQSVAADPAGEGPIDRLALMDALSELVEASMLVPVRGEQADLVPGEGQRYRMLETPRLFALQLLHDRGQHDDLRQRHLAWCLGWVDGADVGQLLTAQAQLKLALDWALSGGDVPGGTLLAERLMGHPGVAALNDPAAAATSHPTVADDTLPRLLQRLKLAGVAHTAERAGLADDTLLALAQRLRPAELSNLDGAVRELSQAVDLARSAVDQPLMDDLHDRHIGHVLAQVAELTRNGRFDEGSDLVDEALAEQQRREARRRAAHHESMRLLLESGVQQDLLRRDAFAVARRTAALLSLDSVDPPSRTPAWREREAQAMALGQANTGTLWLEVATELARWRLAEAGDAGERASARLALAQALLALGERDAGTDVLDRAAQTCRDALGEITRDDDARTWSALQHELATALGQIGMRVGDTAMLQEAVQCCEAALCVRTRDTMPLDWAATQHVHGVALRNLGMLGVGTLRLEHATRVLREALLERTPARAPVARARTLNMLGIALSVWAAREEGPQRHREALAVQQSALALLKPDAAPTLWATICNNIGIEYNFLGSAGLEPETQWRAATEAFRRGLGVVTRDTDPNLWSRLQHNLGVALAYLGDHLADPDLLREAADAFGQSLQENTLERQPVSWAASKNDLGTALARRGRLTPGAAGQALMEQGLKHLQDCLVVRTPEAMPNEWLRTMGDVAFVQLRLGQHTGDPTLVRRAAETSSMLLAQPQTALMPYEQANIAQFLAEARAWLSARPASGRRDAN